MDVTSSNISIRELNNDFKDTISLTDTVTQTKNNTTGEQYSIEQDILVNKPIDFNNGTIPNLNALTFVTAADVKSRSNSNPDSRGVYQYSSIKRDRFLLIEAKRTINLINLIRMSAISNTTVDILDDFGSVIKTISDINDILYNSSVLKHIVNNTTNEFTGQELENYSLLSQNNVPIKINDKKIQILESVNLNYMLITLANLNQENVLMKKKNEGLSQIQTLSVGIRFNIDINAGFPIKYPWVNTNFDAKTILSDPIQITMYIRTPTNIIEKMNSGELSKIFIYL